MKWNKDKVFFVLIVLITVWFTITKLQEASFIRNQYTAVSVRLKTGGVSLKDLNTALVKEKLKKSRSIPEVTAWTRINEVNLRNKNLDRTQKVSAIITAGNMALTAPMSLVSGNYVYQQDKKGCVIDTKTSYALFGTEAAVNTVVTYEKKEYRVRGVVRTDYPVFLIQGKDTIKEYSNLELDYKDKERGESLTEEFLVQNGLAADDVTIDGYFFGRFIYSFIILPVWVFFLWAAYKSFRYFLKEKDKQKPGALLLYGSLIIILLIGYGLLLYHITGNPIYIPEKLIPTKWSDFDYWTRQFLLIKDKMQQMRYLIPNPKDVYLLNEISKLYLNVAGIAVLHMFIIIAGKRFN
jgi:hypothetical protein